VASFEVDKCDKRNRSSHRSKQSTEIEEDAPLNGGVALADKEGNDELVYYKSSIEVRAATL
jgi:hypothetical protein